MKIAARRSLRDAFTSIAYHRGMSNDAERDRRKLLTLIVGALAVVAAGSGGTLAGSRVLAEIASALLGTCGVLAIVYASSIRLAASDVVPSTTTAYPVHLDARIDEPLSRWLWLVKWALLVPQAIVLACLFVAFVVDTIWAWFAIAATQRYPRAAFATNLAILRYAWRVAFYGYGALGTDRYPPFTLRDVPYPARLEIAYPTYRSRARALVAPLLALPHLILLSAVAGSATIVASTAVVQPSVGTLLVLFAAIALAWRGRYPPGLFDVIVGLARWTYRVVAYATLMCDDYPPFRLDLGGTDATHGAAVAPSTPA